MDIVSLSSAPVTGLNSSSSRKGLFERRSFPSEQSLTFPYRRWCPDVPQLNYRDFRARASGVVRSTIKSNQETTDEMKQETQVKDDNLAFVAGATGKVGSRTVRELLKLGFKVRAGVRSPQKAESLVQSVRQMKLDDGSTGIQYVEKLEIVECDLENRSNIGPAIGNASMVLCCIGASEKEIFDITGPYRIDYQATKNLIDAATVAKVDHFILLTSLGTNKIGFPAAILNLFWGVLIWKRKAEESLIASGLPYTIVRPGGMERPTDAYKETHNIFLAEGDTLFGGQVSNLQVAELMAFMAKNRILSYCKVVEVIAETSAPLTPLGELLVKIPSQRPESQPREPETAPSKSASEPVKFDSEKEPTQTKAQKTRPLSPYVAYDDLKPPTSPTPTPPGNPKGHIGVMQPVSESDTPKINIGIPGLAEGVIETKSAAQVEVQKTSPLSPYVVYDDLKPPTSPSPNAPTASLFLSSTQINNSIMEPLKAGKPGDNQPFEVPKSRPFSPFTMYENVKPPASPIPPLRKW